MVKNSTGFTAAQKRARKSRISALHGRRAPSRLMLGASMLALQTVLLTGASLTPAAAQTNPGGTIINPLNDEVLEIDTDLGGVVLTTNNLLIVVDPMVGDTVVDPADENKTLTITSLIRAIDPDTGDPTGNVIQFVASDAGDPPAFTTIDVVRDATSIVEDLIRQGEDGAVPGDPGGPFIIPPANGDQNTVRDIDTGKGGEGGRRGVGVRVCFIVCGTVGRSATDDMPAMDMPRRRGRPKAVPMQGAAA